MSYFAICTFDLANASAEDYQNAYADLARIGFTKIITADRGSKITLPTTTTAGEFNGTNTSALRDDLVSRVKNAFAARRFRFEIFISVGGGWAWGHRTI